MLAVPVKESLFSAFPFLKDAGTEVQEQLRLHGQPVSLPSGHFIGREGQKCGHMSLLLSGSVRVHKVGETGREITLYRLEPGDSCILTASCILSDQEFPAHAIAETDVDAFVIPAPVLRDWVARYEVWRQYVFRILSQRLADVIAVVEEVAFRRLDVRLADYLADALPKTLHTTHEAIAADLGSSREVVSRLLKEFERAGLIALSRGCLTVRDEDGLRELADRRAV